MGAPHPHHHHEEIPYDDRSPEEPESLLLDIGGDVGALVLYADESCLGTEVDLTPVGTPQDHRVHTMIRRRRAPALEFVAGVYPALTAGRYTVWGLDGSPIAEVEVEGGRVAEVDGGSLRAPSLTAG